MDQDEPTEEEFAQIIAEAKVELYHKYPDPDERRRFVLSHLIPVEDIMADPVQISDLQYAIGDLAVARRHVARLMAGTLPVSPMVLSEIEASLDRCVERLERLDRQTDNQRQVIQAALEEARGFLRAKQPFIRNAQ